MSDTAKNTAERIGAALPRGLRNKNPFNIRKSAIGWVGKTGNDGAFEKFSSLELGLRAGMMNMRTHFRKYGLDTVAKLISRHAPGTDGNNETAFVRTVSKAGGIGANETIDWQNKALLARIFAAVVQVENGRAVELALIEKVITDYKI
jgi:hypothetical protein